MCAEDIAHSAPVYTYTYTCVHTSLYVHIFVAHVIACSLSILDVQLNVFATSIVYINIRHTLHCIHKHALYAHMNIASITIRIHMYVCVYNYLFICPDV